MTRFQHPRVLSKEYRHFNSIDFAHPQTPFGSVLAGYSILPDGAGWTASTVIDGKRHLIRGGIGPDGPRSVNLDQDPSCGVRRPGVYAIDLDSFRVFELLPKASADAGCPLDAIDVIPYGYPADTIPGWNPEEKR